MQQRTHSEWLPLAVLTVGFLAIAAGIYSAHTSPATGYEVSLYRATPLAYWVGWAVALAGGVGVAVKYRDYTPPALLLAGISILSAMSLPVVRGYHYYGAGDALTHLGWTRSLVAGESPVELFYPGSHLIATAIHAVGFDVRHAMVLVPTLFVLVFILFVPLTVRAIIPDRDALLVGAFSALFLLPIFHIGTTYVFVPYTFSMLFSAFVLYLMVRYVIAPIREEKGPVGGISNGTLPVGATGVLLTIAGVTLILLHSQLMADVVVLLGTVAVIQHLYRRRQPDHPIASQDLVTAQTGLLLVLFVAWNATHEAMFTLLTAISESLFSQTGIGVASTVSQRGGSLRAIGASLPEIFLKLFLVNSIFVAIAVGLVAAVLFRRSVGLPAKARQLVLYLGVGGITLLPLLLLHFTGISSSFFFRHIGFGMVLITVLGSIGLYHLGTTVSLRVPWQAVAAGTTVALVLSVLVVYPSPYLYLPNQHVTEAQMSGYEHTFETDSEEVQFAGIRGLPGRYSSAFPGLVNSSTEGRIKAIDAVGVNRSMIRDGLASQFDRDTYFVVTKGDKQREFVAYDELRYSRGDIASVSRQPNVSVVSAYGGYTVYYIEATSG